MTIAQETRTKIKQFRPISQEVNLYDFKLNDKSRRLYKFKDETESKFIVWIFTDRIRIETELATSLLFSINIPDLVFAVNTLVNEITGIGKAFTTKSQCNEIQFCIDLLHDELKSLNLRKNEGLNVYSNSLQLTLIPDRLLLPEMQTLKKIKSLIELNYPDTIVENDYSDLPTEWRAIVEKFESFTISDDFERDEKIRKLSKKKRSELIEAIQPKFGEINAFLDSFGDKPLSDGAIGLQCLAALVCELMLDREENNHS